MESEHRSKRGLPLPQHSRTKKPHGGELDTFMSERKQILPQCFFIMT